MQRVMIVGQPGSGKSTLARAMGARTGLPVVHIDHIHWMPGWQERPRAEKTRMCHEVEAGEAWIFEGGHSATWGNRLARADMLIWLDVPVWRRFGRVVWRTWVYRGQSRPDLPENCPEGFHKETLPFWRWIWRTRNTQRANIQSLWDGVPEGTARVRLRTLAEVREFLAGLGQAEMPPRT
jgi:adenylate kinase family enzyme